jgi:hypothetical protein
MSFRRYEIILPIRYNSGHPVEREKFFRTNRELVERFGAVSFAPETLSGIWIHEGREYAEENVRLFVMWRIPMKMRNFSQTGREP